MNNIITRLKSDSGNVESALVMLPLISLFLITLQLIATVNLRNVDMTTAQNKANIQAIKEVPNEVTNFKSLNSGDLFTKLRLIITNIEREVPEIFPAINQLIGDKKLKSSGVAVYEEPEDCIGGYLLC